MAHEVCTPHRQMGWFLAAVRPRENYGLLLLPVFCAMASCLRISAASALSVLFASASLLLWAEW